MSPIPTLTARGKTLQLPAFLPDATYGYVRALAPKDLTQVGVKAVMMNGFHLMQKPGSSIVTALGGLHKMSGWPGLIMTDSGGFQAYSLIRQNPKFGSLSEKGITFYPEGSKRKLLLTPEKSIQLQMSYDSDILICLDDCTHVDASRREQELSVERTIAWAQRAKQTYLRMLESKQLSEDARPLIFGVIQGGGEMDLRKRCADALLEIGFDGFGFGGWPLDAQSNLLTDILEYTRSVIPREFPIHALGLGHPESIIHAYKMGYEMFDSALPTRDARHGRLYAGSPSQSKADGSWLVFKYADRDQNLRDDGPISEGCDCPVCANLSVGYLNHLWKQRDLSYARLATQHNLRFMTQLMEGLKSNAPAA